MEWNGESIFRHLIKYIQSVYSVLVVRNYLRNLYNNMIYNDIAGNGVKNRNIPMVFNR
jgi:hypothetical protein